MSLNNQFYCKQFSSFHKYSSIFNQFLSNGSFGYYNIFTVMSNAMINIYNMCMCPDTHDTSSIVLNDRALVVELLDGRIFLLLINLTFRSVEIFIHPQHRFLNLQLPCPPLHG